MLNMYSVFIPYPYFVLYLCLDCLIILFSSSTGSVIFLWHFNTIMLRIDFTTNFSFRDLRESPCKSINIYDVYYKTCFINIILVNTEVSPNAYSFLSIYL
jgi:hypothetical protein